MNMNASELKIDQSGTVSCPLCGNVIPWKCKVEIMVLPYCDNKIASMPNTEPTNAVGYYFKSDGKVIFRVACERCGSCTETEPMEMVGSQTSKLQ